MLARMRRAVPPALLLLLCSALPVPAQAPIRIDPGFQGFGPAPSQVLDLAPPAPELPRDEARGAGLTLGFGASLAPSTLDQLDAHDPHRLLERGHLGAGTATGLSPYIPERLGATLTFPF